MKKILTLFVILFCSISYGQCDLNYEFVDSSARSKEDIYALTKAFIAYTWNNANFVIMNDDKESGLIIVKGIQPVKTSFLIGLYDFSYKFTSTFRMKDNKVKMTIDNVVCDRATLQNQYLHQTPCIPALKSECLDLSNAVYKYNLPKNKVIFVSNELNTKLDAYLLKYKSYIKSEKKLDDW